MKDGTELLGTISAKVPDSTVTISLMEGSTKIMLYNEITQIERAIVTAVGEETRRLQRLTVRSAIKKGMPGNRTEIVGTSRHQKQSRCAWVC